MIILCKIYEATNGARSLCPREVSLSGHWRLAREGRGRGDESR